MIRVLVLALFSFSCLCAQEPLEHYFSYLQKISQPCGNFKEGEIEVVMDPVEISRIEKIQENRLIKKGFSAEDAKEFSRVGVICEDQYWIWLRDAVYFPNGIPGTYNRQLWKSQLLGGYPGVAVLPILPSGHVVLILTYRHATRSWELELPRGSVDAHETMEEAARRELQEETGMEVTSMNYLGGVAADSGVLSSAIPVYLGRVSFQGRTNQEYSEAISDVISFTKEEIRAGLVHGYLEVTIQNKKKKIPLRDAFLTYALLQAELHGLL